jgi:alpha/beta superfamily hydrolase
VIIHGSSDQVVPEAAAAKLAERLSHQRGIKVDYVKIDGANHFFENETEELMRSVDNYLDFRLSPECPIR